MVVALAQPPVRQMPPAPIVTLPVPARPKPPPPPNMSPMMPGHHSPPPPPLPEPSAAANALALRLIERIGLFEREVRESIRNQLLWSGPEAACDQANEECRGIAEEIARREAASKARIMRNSVSRVLGAMFDRDMTPAQIAQADRFLGGDAGQALIGSLLSINEQSLAALGPPSRFFGGPRADLAEEFARRTRHLPRALVPVPPSAPAIYPSVRPAPPPPAPPPSR